MKKLGLLVVLMLCWVGVAQAVTPQVVAGSAHAVALREDGTVNTWGLNSSGQLGNGTTIDSNTPVTVIGLADTVTTVAAGGAYSLALLADGTVKAWGTNSSGQLGDGTTTDSSMPVTVTGLGGTVIAISAGSNHTLALLSDGTVKAWGINNGGQLGDGTTTNSSTPVTVTGLGGTVTAISAGATYNLALLADGTVKAWGQNSYGQLGNGTTTSSSTPVTVTGLGGTVSEIAAGGLHSLALLSNGTVEAWGYNAVGQLGNGITTDSSTPVTVTGLGGSVTSVAANNNHSLALLSDGTVNAWGMNNYGQLGNGTTTNSSTPVTVIGLGGSATAITTGSGYTLALLDDGSVKAWGDNNYGQLGVGAWMYSSEPVSVTLTVGSVTALAGGSSHNLALLSDGTVKAWGNNNLGQLGNGSTTDSSTPVTVTGLGGTVTAISAGGAHSLALLSDGTVKAWGHNGNGQLGNGTTTASSTPVMVTGLGGTVIAIAAGYSSSYAVLSDGSVKAWGHNFYGQLGNGTTTGSSTPVTVAGLGGTVTSVKAGERHAVALLSDGTVKTWGNNSYRQLGDGTTTSSTTPVMVTGLGGTVTEIAAGYLHNVVLLADGTVKSWGFNFKGELGDGTTTSSSTPVPVVGLGGAATSITAGVYRSMALLSDGSVKSWGYNNFGQLGNGLTLDSTTPVTASRLVGSVSAIAARSYHSMALMSDGTVKAWGYNNKGQLGDGTSWITPQSALIKLYDTPVPPPAAPTQIEATDLGVGEVLLTWVNPSDADFDHIVIYRSTISGQSGTVLIDGLTNISFIDGSVNERTTYRYTVRSVDAAGNESTNTAQVAVTTKDLAPGTPTALSAVDVTTGNAIDLSWVNPLDSDFNCVNIYRSEVSGVLGALVGNCVAGTSMQDIGLANGVTYYYLARAVDNGGHLSANSNQASATSTSSADASGAAEVSAISFTDPSNGRTLTLNWTNPADPDLAYALIYRSTNGSKGELIDGVDIQGMEGLSGAWWVDEDVQGCVTYYYTIATLDDAGNESAGVQASHAVADTEAPLPITGLTVTPVAGNQVTLSWKPSPSADADCYQVYYATTGSLSPLGTCLPDPASVFTPAPLAADTDYTFAMRTTGACNQMEMNSNTVTVRTSADPAGANSCKATIKSPKIGHTVGGNSVTIVADVSCTGAATVNDVQFEYSADNGSNWVVMSDASAVPLSHPASFPNPDATAPYFVHWDTSAVAGPAAYLLRAVTDTDTDPGTLLITIDNSSVPQALESNGGSQQKTEAVYLNAPGSCVMGDEDGLSAIEIPADALSADTEVLILDVDTPPVAPPSNYVSIGAYKDIHFGNGQGQLNNDKKAKVFLSYTDDDENGIVDGTEILVDDLQLCSDHGNSWTCLNSTVDRANKQVRGYVDKFSTFALMVPPKLVGSSLTMVTVPLHANPNSTASVLGPVNRYGTYTPVWNPATGSWITNPGTVEPGKSYFVWGNGKALDVSGVEVDQVDFDISLVPGWNMIGNPFRYEVAMADLTVSCGGAPVSLQTAANNGWLIGTVYHYVNGSWLTWSVQDGDNLPAWKGLYLLSDQSCTLTVPPNPVGPQNCYDGAACVDYYDSWGWFLFTDCYVNTYCY